MLYYALVFLVVGLLAGALGAFGVAAMATQIAWILFVIGVVLVVLHLVTGRGDRVLGRGPLDAPGPAAVDELELAHLAHRRHRRGATLGELERRAPLDEADRRGTQALTRRPVPWD